MSRIMGKYVDAMGKPLSSAKFILIATKTTQKVIGGTITTINIDLDGSYDFNLFPCSYRIGTYSDEAGFTMLGDFVISDSTIDGSLNELILRSK